MDKKIMLVDDAAFMRMTIKNVLTKMGYTNLLEASDGAQAVELYEKENPDHGYHYAQHGWHPGTAGNQVQGSGRQGDHVFRYGPGGHGSSGHQGGRYGLYR